MTDSIRSIEVDIGDSRGPLLFDDVESLQNWLAAEVEALAFLDVQAFPHSPPVKEVTRLIREPLKFQLQQCREAVSHYEQNQKARGDSLVERIAGALREIYVVRGLPVPGSPERVLVEDLAERGAAYAIAALTFSITDKAPNSQTEAAIGIVEYKQAISGWNATAGSMAGSLSQLHEDFAGWLSKNRSDTARLTRQHHGLMEELERRMNRTRRVHGKWMHSTHENWVQFTKRSEKELESIAAAYDQHMSLKAPVDYWARKRSWHWTLSVALGVVLGLIGYFGTVALWDWSVAFLAEAQSGNGGAPSPWQIGAIIVVLLLFLWVLRLIVRVLLSQVHLAIDADERVVMTKTFLAIVRDPETKNEADRHLILSALFRTTQTGIVKDDAIPPSLLAAASKILTGGGKPGSH